MPVFVCRCENGDVSFVAATNKGDAIALLDEVGGADEGLLTAVKDLIVHCHLDDNGEMKLEGFGETTASDLSRMGYPVLQKARMELPDSDEAGWKKRTGRSSRMRSTKRERVYDQKVPMIEKPLTVPKSDKIRQAYDRRLTLSWHRLSDRRCQG